MESCKTCEACGLALCGVDLDISAVIGTLNDDTGDLAVCVLNEPACGMSPQDRSAVINNELK